MSILPWPFQISPVRDTCTLLSDLEVDQRFDIYTMIFLNTGGVLDYRGGVTLFADQGNDDVGSEKTHWWSTAEVRHQ